MWSSKISTIHFLLGPLMERPRNVHLRITGIGVPGRLADVSLNGVYLGTIQAGQDISDFVVDGNILRPGQQNRLTFIVKNAGPNRHDWRVLGFFVKNVE